MTGRATAWSYDRVARRYAEVVGGELVDRPLERGLLEAVASTAGAGGVLADLGCGPGHVTAYLAGLGLDARGLDLSPGMIALAGERAPALRFDVGSMLELPYADDELDGAVALYSVIHLDTGERGRAYAEAARVVRAGGPYLVSFHVSGTSAVGEHEAGDAAVMTTWWDEPVELTFHFLDPDAEAAALERTGWRVVARLDRAPVPGVEAQTRRCSLLAVRHGPPPVATIAPRPAEGGRS